MKIEVQNEEDKNDNQFARKEIIHEDKDKTLERLYQKDEFQIIQKPPKISVKILLTSIFISFIVGILIGFFAAYFLGQNLKF